MTKASVFFLVVMVLLTLTGCGEDVIPEEKEEEVAGPAVVAENWVRENAPTFTTRNGTNLEHHETTETEEGNYNVRFVFEASFGYGTPKEGNVVTDFKTDREIIVTVENETVTKAVTDERYNEIKDVFELAITPTEEEMQIITERVKRLASDSLNLEEFTDRLKKETTRVNFLENTPISVTESDIVEYMTAIDAFDTKEEFLEYWTEEMGISEELLLQEVSWDAKMSKLTDILTEETTVPEERVKRDYEKYAEWMSERGDEPVEYEDFIKHERLERNIIFSDIIGWELDKINDEAESTIKIE